MQVAIRKIGNSQGALIPKSFLVLFVCDEPADMQVKNGVIKTRPIECHPRGQWAKDGQRIARAGDDKLVWPVFSNHCDADLIW